MYCIASRPFLSEQTDRPAVMLANVKRTTSQYQNGHARSI
jgi:hypothetical protein